MSARQVCGVGTAASVAALVAASVAPFVAWRTGESYGAYLALDALAGAATGVLTALFVAALVRRLHTIGYILAIGFLVVLLILTAWLAQSAAYMALAATIAFLAPVYALSVIICCGLIRLTHPDRAP